MTNKVEKLIKIIERKKRIDPQGKERIARVLENKKVDVLSLIFWRPQNVSVPGKTYNMEEQFYDKEKMLYAHLEEIADCAQNTFDAPLCLRPNFGTVFIPSMFGLKYKVPKDTFAWITSHLSKDEIRGFNFSDLDKTDLMKRAIDYIQYFKEKLQNGFMCIFQIHLVPLKLLIQFMEIIFFMIFMMIQVLFITF